MVRSVFAVLSIVIVVGISAPTSAENGQASSVIRGLYETLLGVMKNADRLGFAGRQAQLMPVVASAYNMRLIARATAGAQWKQIAKADRKRLVDTLMRLTTATYAARFNGYSGEALNVLGEEPAPRDTVLVKTELVTGGGDTIPLDYLMHQTKAGWRIADIYLNGSISQVSVQRSEYTSVIERAGVNGLITALEGQIETYTNDGAN
jgi:phospholipid transport system substrate-binding protein